MLDIRLRTPCYPTEDRDAVVRAIRNLFPDAEIEGDVQIVAISKSLDAFGELLKRHKIRDAARKVMRRGMTGNTTHFRLNKQVAAVGKVSFSEESHALGDIEVFISAADIESVIDSTAPNTRQVAER
ncbi:MAG: hypothetical protein JW880_06070 [Candidatus Thermoplasmatota archaeon]|nr:hypothetical protein [Candidatus Thermoplasmatota archaeon]